MKTAAICMLLLACFFVRVSYSQGTFFEVPINEVMPVVVFQPNSPFEITRFSVVKDSTGQYQTTYRLRNSSSKSIESYRIARLFSDRNGFLQYGVKPDNAKPFIAGSVVDSLGKDDKIVPSKDSSSVAPYMKRIAFFMIVEVRYSDGSVFNAMPAYDSLMQHLDLFVPIYEKLN
jgi:hypothetical protein